MTELPRLTARGLATPEAAVLQEARLKLGDSSTAAARIAATRVPSSRGLAELEGCLDTSLQDQPRLGSIGRRGVPSNTSGECGSTTRPRSG